MPHPKFFETSSFFKKFNINNVKANQEWNELIKFNHQIQHIGLDKGYMMKLVYVDTEGITHDVILKATCPCCKGNNPDIVFPFEIGRCKETAENKLRIKLNYYIKNNYMIIDDDSSIIQPPETVEIKIAE